MRRSKPGLRFLYSYSSRNNNRFSALEPDIAPETAVLRKRPPKTLLEHPPKRTTFYVLLRRRKLSKCVYCSICGGNPGFTQNHLKVGRRTSVHDLQSPKLPSEQRHIDMTMNSYAWKMWRCVQQRSLMSNC